MGRFGVLYVCYIVWISYVHGGDVAKPKNVPLFIAGVMPLASGQLADYGQRARAVMNIAVDEINANKIVLPNNTLYTVFNDSQSDPALGLRRSSDLMRQDLIMAIVGDLSSSCSKPMSLLAGTYQIPTISPASTAKDLSDKSLYPYFSRTVPPDTQQAAAIVDVALKYSWQSIIVLYSNDDYGTSFLSCVEGVVSDLTTAGLTAPTIVGRYEIKTGSVDSARTQLQSIIKAKSSYIIIFVALDLDVKIVLQAATDLNMIGTYTFMGTDSWAQNSLVDGAESEAQAAMLKKALKGVIGTVPITPDTVESRALAAKCKLLNPVICAVDDSYMYYAYDAVYVIAYAMNDIIRNDSALMDGATLLKRMRLQQFNGTTGPIQINSDGDRLGSYDVVNFGTTFSHIGLWSAATGLSISAIPMFADGTNTPSIDVPPRDIYAISHGTINGCIVLSALTVAMAFGADLLLWINRAHKVIKTSSVTFCHLIVLGCLMGLLYPSIMGAGHNKGWGCSIPLFFLGTGFSLTFGSLFIKTWRIHKIFNNESIKLQKLRNRDLLIPIGALVIFEALIHLLWNTVDAPYIKLVSYPLQELTDQYECDSRYYWLWFAIVIGSKVILVLFIASIAWAVRDVPHNWNESKWIAISVYNVLVIAILGGAVLLITQEPSVHYIIQSVACCFVFLNTLVIVFGPKLYNIYISKEWMLPDLKNGARVARASNEGDLRSPNSAAQRGGASAMPNGGAGNAAPGTKHARSDAKLLGTQAAGASPNSSSPAASSVATVSGVKLNVDTNNAPASPSSSSAAAAAASAAPSEPASPSSSNGNGTGRTIVTNRKLSTLTEDDELAHRASMAV